MPVRAQQPGDLLGLGVLGQGRVRAGVIGRAHRLGADDQRHSGIGRLEDSSFQWTVRAWPSDPVVAFIRQTMCACAGLGRERPVACQAADARTR